MAARIVIDTSVFVAALIGRGGPNRELLRRCLRGVYRPLMGNSLMAEHEAVINRPAILKRIPATSEEIQDLLDALCATAEWVPIYYLLPLNLVDEGDNHILELATAGDACWVVTNNLRAFAGSQLHIPDVGITTPEQLLKES